LQVSRSEDLVVPELPRVRNAGSAGFIHWINADLVTLKRIGENTLDLAAAAKQPITAIWGHYFLASVHYHRNELAEARVHAEQVFDRRRAYRGFYSAQVGIILAHIHQAAGNSALAGETLAQTYRHMVDLQSAPLIATVEACQVELDVRQGGVLAAAQWARHALPGVRLTPLPLFYGPPLAMAKALLAANQPADTTLLGDYLARWRDHLVSIHNFRFLIEVLALEALFYEGQGDRRTASAALERSLNLAEPSGFLRLYADLGQPMKKLLLRLSSGNVKGDYISRILAAFPGVKPAPNEALVEPLTQRELQVLQFLAFRLSNKEIAQELVIAPVTVKRHTINIYQKLGVQTRRDAVLTAQQLGILD
jgi:LuxR family transcriptional regulator, maltose regulon positive regulatory protein